MIRPNLLRIEAYAPGKGAEALRRDRGLERVIKLASNENPLGPSPMAVEAVRAAADAMHLYPDASGASLKAGLSERFGVPESCIVLGNGSDDLIQLLGTLFLEGPDDEVIMGDPSFVRYQAVAQIANCALIKVPLDSGMRHDLAAMARAVSHRTKLIFIANPNNPTGTIVTRSEFEAFLADAPSQAVVVLDEAYFEFASENEEYPSSVDYVLSGRPVIGLRTFSKTYGLAGARVGYGFMSERIASVVERVRQPFSVNSLAQVAAVAALRDREHLRRTVENNRAGLAFLTRVFERHGAKCVPSHANFVLGDLGYPAEPVFQELMLRGVIVRPGSTFGMENCLRVSVGTPEEMEAFAEAFSAAVGSAVV